MPIYDKTLAENPQFRGALELPEGGFRLFGDPKQPNYAEEYGVGATGNPYLQSQIFSGRQTTPAYSGIQELAKMKEEQEAAAFLLYGIAMKNAKLMATEMPTPEGGKLVVPDPVIQQLAAEGFAENKRQIDMWYKTGRMQIENIGSSSLLNSDEQYQAADKLMIEINSKRPVIIPQSTTMPTMQNIKMEAPQGQSKSIYTPQEQTQIDTAVKSGDLNLAATIQQNAQKREKELGPIKEIETQIVNATKIGDYITAAKLQNQIKKTKIAGLKAKWATETGGRWGAVPPANIEKYYAQKDKSIPTVLTQETYNKLPSNTEYYDSQGRKWRKQ